MEKPSAYSVGGPPTDLDFEKSLMFFHAYMYGPLQGKLRLYTARGVRPGSVAMSSDWEVFASMLVNDLGTKLGAGIDLAGHEVKSAGPSASYEYQYHKKSGRDKLAKDAVVGHLFFEYSDNLRRVDLRYAHGSSMGQFFDAWLRAYPDPYPQRYRKNIPYGWVKENGLLLMTLKNGEVTYPAVAPAPAEPVSLRVAESPAPKVRRRRGTPQEILDILFDKDEK
jgi:hypothetical protein